MPTYPLALPTVTGIRQIEWIKDSTVATSEGAFDLKTKVYDWGGKRWSIVVVLPPMVNGEWRVWEAFLLSLNGPEGTFRLGPTMDKTASGTASGTPLINGGSQSGQSVVSDGWTASETGILKAGDWVQIGDYLYRVLADVNSDASGNCTFEIWPNLRAAPADNDPIITTNPVGLFRLVEIPSHTQSVDGHVHNLTFRAVEAI